MKVGGNVINEKILLTPKDILEKDFKIDARGYRMQEVDKFLDVIMGDYTEFFNCIRKLENDKEDLLNDIMKLKQEIRTLKTSLDIAKGAPEKEITNVDLMRRLGQLEKIVYGRE